MRFRLTLIAVLLAGAALAPAPALAEEQAAPAIKPAVSPAALEAARPVVDKIWPLGTYRRMMDGTMSKMMDGLMGSMFDMKAGDFMGAVDESGKLAKEAGDSSMGELAEKADPHFRERMKITMDVMMKELIPLMDKIEPTVRTNMTAIYARKFSVPQLQDMNRFFSTPSGKAYAEQSMLVFMEPEIMSSMQAFIPDMMKAMPDITKKIEVATAHLPKPKPKEDEPAAVEETEAPWELSENWAPEYQSAMGRANDKMDQALEDMDSVRQKAVAEARKRLEKK